MLRLSRRSTGLVKQAINADQITTRVCFQVARPGFARSVELIV
jgi:hypothetical protein